MPSVAPLDRVRLALLVPVDQVPQVGRPAARPPPAAAPTAAAVPGQVLDELAADCRAAAPGRRSSPGGWPSRPARDSFGFSSRGGGQLVRGSSSSSSRAGRRCSNGTSPGHHRVERRARASRCRSGRPRSWRCGTARGPCSAACPARGRSGSGSGRVSTSLTSPRSVSLADPVVGDQDVVRLDVAVDRAPACGRRCSPCADLGDEPDGLGLGHRPVALDPLARATRRPRTPSPGTGAGRCRSSRGPGRCWGGRAAGGPELLLEPLQQDGVLGGVRRR